MSKIQTPYRYDFVGSFLRPQVLKDAKKAYQNEELSKEDFEKVVDEEVTKIVAKQKELGFHVITDGEFRRTFWHLDFMWGFEGVAHENTGNGVKFDAELALLDDTYLVGKIKAKAHPFVEGFKFLKQFEDEQTNKKYVIKVDLDEATYSKLLQRYKELENDGGIGGDDIPFDLKAHLTEIDTGLIDTAYMNSRFEKYIKALDAGIPPEELEAVKNDLHKSFALLSQEEQKYANIFLHDIEINTIIVSIIKHDFTISVHTFYLFQGIV